MIAAAFIAALGMLTCSTQAAVTTLTMNVDPGSMTATITQDQLLSDNDVSAPLGYSGTISVDVDIPPTSIGFNDAAISGGNLGFSDDGTSIFFGLIETNQGLTASINGMTVDLSSGTIATPGGLFNSNNVTSTLDGGVYTQTGPGSSSYNFATNPLSDGLASGGASLTVLPSDGTDQILVLTLPYDVTFDFSDVINPDPFTNLGNQTFRLQGTIVARAYVPEPGSLAVWSILGLSIAGAGWIRRRRKAA
jgi:hypothetical protein